MRALIRHNTNIAHPEVFVETIITRITHLFETGISNNLKGDVSTIYLMFTLGMHCPHPKDIKVLNLVTIEMTTQNHN